MVVSWRAELTSSRTQFRDSDVDRSSEASEKIQRLVRFLAAEQAGGVLISSKPNFAWLTAGGSNTIDTTRETGVASLLVLRDGKSCCVGN